jgi:four helix bundle protein
VKRKQSLKDLAVDKIKSVEELEVFKKSHQFTLRIYDATKRFPAVERFGLIPQMTRAAASLCTNLMEGSHRLNRAEYRHFAGIAKGSAGELKYQLLLAQDLGYISKDEYNQLKSELEEISKMLNGLIKALSPPKH